MHRHRQLLPPTRELQGLLLYLVSLVLAGACSLVRLLVAFFSLALIWLVVFHTISPVYTLAAVIAYGPLGWSLFGLVWAAGAGWWWRQTAGGRRPSSRESAAYEEALANLTDHQPGLRAPRHWFVLDETDLNAAALGDTLMLHRATLESEFLEPILAHELGHLHSTDARLTAATNRLVFLPGLLHEERHGLFQRLWFVASGAAALRATGRLWASYWRAREYTADQYALQLGQGAQLAEFLDSHVLLYDRPVPLVWMSEHTHPPTELRHDRLTRITEAEGGVTGSPEPVKGGPTGRASRAADAAPLTEPADPVEQSIRRSRDLLPGYRQTETHR